MGLLKRLPSLSFKGRSKVCERPPLPTSATALQSDAQSMDASNVKSWTDPSVGTSFFDDIFLELGQSSPDKDAASQADVAYGLSPLCNESNSKPQSNTKLTALTPSNTTTSLATNKSHPKISTPIILDSDVSGTEDEDDNDDEDESTDEDAKKILEPHPIIERRLRNHKKRGTDLGMETILDRMKDRHRQQVQAMRQPTRHHHSAMISPSPSINPMVCATPMISPPSLTGQPSPKTRTTAFPSAHHPLGVPFSPRSRPAAPRYLPSPPCSVNRSVSAAPFLPSSPTLSTHTRTSASSSLPPHPTFSDGATVSSTDPLIDPTDADDEADGVQFNQDMKKKRTRKRPIKHNKSSSSPPHALKSMCSEPDFTRFHQPHALYYQQMLLQQQQIRLEWERIQLYKQQQDYYLQQLRKVKQSTTLPCLQSYYPYSFNI